MSKKSEACFEPNSDEFQRKVCFFYQTVLKKVYGISREKFVFVRQSLGNIRSYKNRDLEEHKSVSFDEEFDRIAYIYGYGMVHSAVFYDRFSAMLKNNVHMLNCIKLKRVQFCILGGGSSMEVVAICSLFNSIVKKNSIDNEPLHLCIKVIDHCEGWKNDAEAVSKLCENSLCDANIMKIDFNFITADLTENLTSEVKHAIKNSHFVTMFKFVSDVHEASSMFEVSLMVHNIMDSMRPKACLFYLDTAGGGVFNNVDRMIDANAKRIYGPCQHNVHVLNAEAVQNFTEGLCCFSGTRILNCTQQIKISCSAWFIQKGNIIKTDEIYMDSIDRHLRRLGDEESRKNKVKNTEKSKNFNKDKKNIKLLNSADILIKTGKLK